MEEIVLFGQNTSFLEIIAMLTGIAGVWLTIKVNPWCFPVGILNVTLYAVLFFSPGVRLYADALLQCIYILLLIYGWVKWSDKDRSTNIDPVRIKVSVAIRLLFICLFFSVLLSLFLIHFTNATFPWLDSALTCASLAAQWMIARKMIENWIVWIVADLVYLPLYMTKHLPLTAFLYAVFLLLAIKGYLEWRKKLVAHGI